MNKTKPATLDTLADTYHSVSSLSDRSEQQLKTQIIEKAEPYIRKIMNRVNVPTGIEYGDDDLKQEAYYMVIKALENYDPSKDNKFSTYMYIRVRGRIIQYVRNNDSLTRTQRNKVGEIRKARHELEQEKDRKPSPSEIATAIGRSAKDVRALIKAENSRQSSELDGKVFDHEGSRDQRLERKFRKEEVQHKLSKIPVRERVILILYFYLDLTGKEIAEVVDLNHSYVYQMKSQALDRLEAL